MNAIQRAELKVANLTGALREAKAELAAARKAERDARKNDPEPVDKAALNALRFEISNRGWNSKIANRDGKVYITIDQPENSVSGFWAPPYNLVCEFFEKAGLTSGGCGHYTFRLNP